MDDFEQLLQETEERYRQRVEVRERIARAIKSGNILEADTSARVTMRLNRLNLDRPRVEELLRQGSALAALSSRPVALLNDQIVLERILGKNELIGVLFLELGLLMSHTVGRVRIAGLDGRIVGYGTGFLVSPRLLLTNNHVLRNEQEAERSDVELNYQIGRDGQLLPSVAFHLDPQAFFVTDRALDYTLVAVQESGTERSLTDFGWNRLIEQEGKVILGERLNIIQHPNGEPKQLALRENQLVDVLDDFLHYRTDTAPGSSGSPVFNDQWEVVALHHSGVPRRDSEGRILTPDGLLWNYHMGEHRIDWIANEGVRTSRILHHLRELPLSSAQDEMRQELLEVQASPKPVTPSSIPQIRAELTETTTPEVASPTWDEDGTATWTVPVSITLRLRLPCGTTTGPNPDAPVITESMHRQVEERQLDDALRELQVAQTRPYYDESQDAENRGAYYSVLSSVSAPSPQGLFEAFSTLVRMTHTTQPRYNPRTSVYPWVDLHPDSMLRSVYSGKPYDPETFIREDLRISRERVARLQEIMATETMIGEEYLQEQIDLLEAQLPYNCEHVVPQSWFSRREPMRGDLHHLFACEVGCNSFRGNNAYFDFSDFEEALRHECGRLMEDKFEPSSGKGAVARAVLYFLLRYPGEINSGHCRLNRDRLSVLLNWHEQFPVDTYEKHRNAAIFEKQGNRNPLIDFPNIARYIDFTHGLGFPED